MSKARKVLASVALSVGFAADVLAYAARKDPEVRVLANELAEWVQRARRVVGVQPEPVSTGRARRLNDPRR